MGQHGGGTAHGGGNGVTSEGTCGGLGTLQGDGEQRWGHKDSSRGRSRRKAGVAVGWGMIHLGVSGKYLGEWVKTQ